MNVSFTNESSLPKRGAPIAPHFFQNFGNDLCCRKERAYASRKFSPGGLFRFTAAAVLFDGTSAPP